MLLLHPPWSDLLCWIKALTAWFSNMMKKNDAFYTSGNNNVYGTNTMQTTEYFERPAKEKHGWTDQNRCFYLVPVSVVKTHFFETTPYPLHHKKKEKRKNIAPNSFRFNLKLKFK